MIDEVSTEQENEANAPHFDKVTSEPGFIRKFAASKKIVEPEKTDAEEPQDSQQVEEASTEETSESAEVVAQLIESKTSA